MLTVLFCNFIIEMKNVEIDGFAFELFISSNQILNKIKDLAKQLTHVYADDFPMCLVVLNGASVFANTLLRHLNPSVEVHMITVKSYDGMKSNSLDFNDIPVNLVKDKKILLIEDIVDTGKTLSFLRNMLTKNAAKQVHCVTLLFKPKKYNYDLLPEHIGFNIGEEFIVGYGMDLNEKGRELKNIYKNIIYQN